MSSSANPRFLAWQVLRRWSPQGRYAEEMIEHEARRAGLSGPNRALLNAIVLAVLRHRSLFDAWIVHLRGGGPLDDEVRCWLHTGLAQLRIMEVPEHAAVNETVALAGRARGLVNAVLRRALREHDVLDRIRAEAPPEIRHSLPPFLVRAWGERWGREAVEVLGGFFNSPAPVFVRANPLRPHAAAAIAALAGAEPLTGFGPGWFRLPEPPRRELAAGLCYVQDLATGLAPSMLDPQPGHAVLDACAAPGGKTAILAALMQNTGALVATDVSVTRLARFRDNMTRLGVTLAEVLLHDWSAASPPPSLRDKFRTGFDRILLDVPCSNTGVLRRRVDARWRLTPEFFPAITALQRSLLTNLLPLLKPGGRLVYSTCSIEPCENGEVVQSVIQGFPGCQILEHRTLLPHRDHMDGGCAILMKCGD